MAESFIDILLNQLFPSGNYATFNSKRFDNEVANLIKSSDVKFNDKKLNLIQKLALSLERDRVFS